MYMLVLHKSLLLKGVDYSEAVYFTPCISDHVLHQMQSSCRLLRRDRSVGFNFIPKFYILGDL